MTKIPRYNARRDANEGEITDALDRLGITYLRLDEVDLLIGYRGCNYLLEVKTAAGRLNQNQKVFADWWKGQWTVVRSIDDVLKVIGAE